MDSGLLKRLLGAAVLIALAVIFVPMLLPGGSSAGSKTVGITIPPEPDGALKTRLLAVGPDSASAGSSTAAAVADPDHVATLDLERGAASRPPAPAAAIEPTVAASSSAPVSVSAPASAAPTKPRPVVAVAPASKPAVPKPAAAPQPAPVAGGAGAAATALYTVNLGIYADHASANKLVANAKRHGFTALASPETYQGKSVLRVTVGPFHSRAEAEAARLKLASFDRVSMTIEAAAVNQQGDAPASALAPTQPGAWAVQLVAYSTAGQANALRDRLRTAGFDGYVDALKTAKGTLWRVRAGPFATRAAATDARAKIVQKLALKGDIVTQH